MNLKQFGLFWSMYTGDNNGYFERGWEGEEYRTCFYKILQPYYSLKDQGLNICPMATKLWSEGGKPGYPDSAWGIVGDAGVPSGFNTLLSGEPEAIGTFSSYGGSGWISNPSPTDVEATHEDYGKFWRTPDIRGGNIVPMLLDCLYIGEFIDDSDRDFSRLVPAAKGDYWDSGMKLFCIDRHDLTVNSLFLDWSARKVDLKELWTLRWHRQYNINNLMTRAGGMSREDWPDSMRNTPDY